jgi:hypothetical protein
LREEIDNDEALSNIYESYKSDKGWSAAQREMRDYQPAKGENVGELDLPNRIMYEVANRRGDLNYVFADEIVLVDRKLLFGKAANALDRYKQRSMQISNLIENIKKESTSISGDLELFMTPEAKAAAEMAKTKPVAKEEGKTPAAS